MRTVGHLFPRITSFDNLYLAARRAMRGKRWRDDVLAWSWNVEGELLALQRDLEGGTYQPGRFRQFIVQDAKRRRIAAAPFRDRVLHHAVCNVIEPVVDARFIADSYASRLGKGTHAALDRYTAFARRHRYVLQCDVSKYFASIDHARLRHKLQRVIRCQPTLDLLARIIAHSPPPDIDPAYFAGDDLFAPWERPRGLPLGNQTSQFFGNLFLNDLDHFIKERLRCRAYVRYADDFVLLHDDPDQLRAWLAAVEAHLAGDRLRLRPNAEPRLTAGGIRFLGFRVFPTHRLLTHDAETAAWRRIRRMRQARVDGTLDVPAARQQLAGWIGHVRHADSWRLRGALFKALWAPLPPMS